MNDLFMKMKLIDDQVEMGKMMSCDGLTYHGKVFCFEYKDKMVFKLGKGYDIKKHGIEEFEYLNPFKNKGPMMAWFEVKDHYADKYESLAKVALEVMKGA
ncbi:hypothetical protein EZV73_08585 [Acidaminobacter sp. JC074]|uniref:hypothetical protein n=1 Tax=Acidaminobacter sp. JC074 TaxID=2530199 RepID=UPI001F0D5ED8|nr:hypothetical protein [Acidaminobacter sp. JC074]MCH4887627.1 hypothetical protein [Acidaminobacter sp. JC074]